MNTPTGMKPFNLQEWKNGAKPICRNGYEPTDLHYFENAKAPLAFTGSDNELTTCFQNGKWINTDEEYDYDLFLKAKKKEGWVVVDKIFDKAWEIIFQTEKEADEFILNCKNSEPFTKSKIEWYE